MHIGNGTLAIGICLLVVAPTAAQVADPVQEVLKNVRQRALDQVREDQRRALLLIQQADTAFQAGRMSEALDLAVKAQQLFPESKEISQAHRNIAAAKRKQNERQRELDTARYRLDEALEQANAWMAEERFAEARELAEAVRTAVGKFPDGVDLSGPRREVERFLEEFPKRIKAAGEPKPAPAVPSAEARRDALRQALGKTLRAEWRGEPLGLALADISQATGMPIVVDPILERARVPETRRVDVRGEASAERLLRTVTSQAGVDHVVIDATVVVTTKAKAVEYTQTRSQGATEEVAARRAGILVAAGEPEPAPPPTKVGAAPVPIRTPEYLRSGRAFRGHIDELLKGFPPKKDLPP